MDGPNSTLDDDPGCITCFFPGSYNDARSVGTADKERHMARWSAVRTLLAAKHFSTCKFPADILSGARGIELLYLLMDKVRLV